jgi:hypothetical protein
MTGKTKKSRALKAIGLTDDQGHDGSSPSELDPSIQNLGSAPSAAEAEVLAAAPIPKPKKQPEPTKPSVPLRVFGALGTIKPDQFKAFSAYVRLEELRPCPILEWRERYEAFLRKPVR